MPKEIAISEQYSDPTLNLALDTIDKDKQLIIFVGSKRGAEKVAEDTAKKSPLQSEELNLLSEEVLKALSSPTKQCKRLAACIKKGTAFHHAGLAQKQREKIETAFREGLLKVISATPTLAMGVDLPAFRVVIRDLKRYGGRWGAEYIPVLEYHQMAGRAGRPGKGDDYGEAVCIAKTDGEYEAIYDKYLLGEPEEIYSKLSAEPVLRMYLLSLISSDFVRTKQQIVDFFSKTFWAHQYEDMYELTAKIDRTLRLLEEYEFLRSESEDFASADEVNDEKYSATLLGKRVAELYLDPLTAHQIINALKRATTKMLTPFSWTQMVSLTLEMRPLLRVKVKEYEAVEAKLTEHEGNLFTVEPSVYDQEYDEYMNSIKTAWFFCEWIEEKSEEYLLETFDIRPGEIRVKLNMANWLLFSAEELARLLQFQKLITEIRKVRYRIQYGVKEELMPLLKLKNVGRVRARKLYNNGFKDLGSLKKADVMTIGQLLGRAVAIDIKKQLGEDVSKLQVPDMKRKGQRSLGRYK